jgi:hypothetical protein
MSEKMHAEIKQALEEGKRNRERRDQFCRERGTVPPGGKWADGTSAMASTAGRLGRGVKG